jgi:thiol-disulfide isomerase/thioredoxin
MDWLNRILVRQMHCAMFVTSLCVALMSIGLSSCHATPATTTSTPSALVGVTTLDGTPTDPRIGLDRSLAVVVFISNDCPISNALAPELCSIAQSARDRGISFYAVHANPPEDLTLVAAHAKDYGFANAMVILLDKDQSLARLTGAKVMPEAVLFRRGTQGAIEILYDGRVNDLYSSLGKRRASPKRNDLRDAIDSAHAGLNPPQSRTNAIGCFIEMSPTAPMSR